MIVSVIDAVKNVNPAYQKWYPNTTQCEAAKRIIATHGHERVLQVIAFLPQFNTMPYFPAITTPSQLEDKWAALEARLEAITYEAPHGIKKRSLTASTPRNTAESIVRALGQRTGSMRAPLSIINNLWNQKNN
jgi:hypothetical protein